MATFEQRQAAIQKSTRIVHSWPTYMHGQLCGCVFHNAESKCGCRSCDHWREEWPKCQR